MIPIKILCGCGQKYAFDAEPVGAGVGCAIQCPVCGSDGTAAANRIMARHLAGAQQGLDDRPPAAVTVSSAAEGSRDRSGRGRGRAGAFLVAIGGGIGVVVVAAILLAHSQGPAGVRAKPGTPERARAATGSSAPADDGVPLSLKDLNAWYVEPPTDQNAATFYSRGFSALQIHDAATSNLPLLGRGELPPPGSPLPASMKSGIAALLHANREARQFFEQGARCDQCRYPVDLTHGFEAPMPHLAKFKSAGLLMELSAISHAEAGKGKQAADDVLVALGLARSLQKEPALLSQLIRAASVSTAVAALEQIIDRTSLPAESLSCLLRILQSMESVETRGEGFNRAMAAERVTSIAMLGSPRKLREALKVAGAHISSVQRDQIIARLDQADKLEEEREYYDETLRQLMAARQATFPGRLNADRLVRQRVAEAADRKLVILELLLPGLAGRGMREAECLAQVRLAQTAVKLEQYRAVHDNRYPGALSELLPNFLSELPADPFDGKPLRYRKTGAGYILYSTGRDLKDDSGKRMQGKEGDIVFAVVGAPRPGR